MWTHTGNVLIQLAIATSDTRKEDSKRICNLHYLENVGTWGTQEPKSAFRPQELDRSLGYVYIRSRPEDGSLVAFSIPSISATSSPQATDLTVLKTASPYRAELLPDDRGTERLLESGLNTRQKICSSYLTGHWSQKQVHFDFLRDFRRHFTDRRMEVKQFQQQGSDYIAFQIKHGELSFAIGFPPDFEMNRQVQVYRGKSSANISLPENAADAFVAVRDCVGQQRDSHTLGEETEKEVNKTKRQKKDHTDKLKDARKSDDKKDKRSKTDATKEADKIDASLSAKKEQGHQTGKTDGTDIDNTEDNKGHRSKEDASTETNKSESKASSKKGASKEAKASTASSKKEKKGKKGNGNKN